jgi:hypothetical protein
MTSYEIATPLTQLVLERRKQMGELDQYPGDTLHRLVHVPSLIANRRRFIYDTDEFLTDAACSQRVDGVTPSFNGRK